MSEATQVGAAEPPRPGERSRPPVPAQQQAPPQESARGLPEPGATTQPLPVVRAERRPAPDGGSSSAEPAVTAEVDEHAVPQLAEGISLCGRYEGAGYTEPRFLIARADGQMVLMSELLYLVTAQIDGRRDLREIARRVSAACGREISPPGIGYLIGDKLHGLGVAALHEPVAETPHADPLLTLALRGVLLPARVVRPLAAVLAWLFLPVLVVAVVCAMVVADVALLSSGALDPAFHSSVGDPLQVLALVLLLISSTLFHETGHAAACHYGGGRPGAIGVGIMLIFPAFYTNVTDAYRLNRASRLRTDLGGLYFNAIFILGATGLFWATAFPPLAVFIVLSHLQMLQQLLPLIRMDGYYILGDLVGVPNLFGHVRPMVRKWLGRARPGEDTGAELRPRVRLLVTCWVAVVVPVLLFAMVMLLFRVPRYLGTALTRGHDYWVSGLAGFAQGQVLGGVLAVFSLLVLLLPWIGGVAFVIRTGRKIGRWYRRKRPRYVPRHAAPATRNRLGLRIS
ncbi:hypothetical protein ACL03H_15195 [Saccharopolyspora sp. MS10]|uniref:hypothetical protein n=1 Tax=Saccharopolyspora sp. MS10 TaxID=3385973 RepID=UPI00399FF704